MDQCCTTASCDRYRSNIFFGLRPSAVAVVVVDNHPFVVVVDSRPFAVVVDIRPFVAVVLGNHPFAIVGILPFAAVASYLVVASFLVAASYLVAASCLVVGILPSFLVAASYLAAASYLVATSCLAVGHTYLVVTSYLVVASFLAVGHILPSFVVASFVNHMPTSTYLGFITFVVASSLGSVGTVAWQLID